MDAGRQVARYALPVAPLLLFDGDCRTCHALVRFVLARDRTGRFRFASQESALGRRLLEEHGLAGENGKTIVLLEDGRAYLRSEAAIRVLRRLSGPARLLATAGALPRPVLDRAYDAFARRRYRLFGRAERCLIVPPEYRDRFLDGSAGDGGETG